jgi:hypothetical protein
MLLTKLVQYYIYSSGYAVLSAFLFFFFRQLILSLRQLIVE